MNMKCPGMDSRYFKPDDIKLHKCIKCEWELEFWKDDVKRKCPKCGQINFNPGLGNTCLVWCKHASDCLGNDDINTWCEMFKKKG